MQHANGSQNIKNESSGCFSVSIKEKEICVESLDL